MPADLHDCVEMADEHRVSVRGVCPNGHEYTTQADTGKLTWRGPCPTCGRKMIARRARPADGDPPPGGLQPKPKPTIKVVEGYQRASRPARRDRPASPPAAGGSGPPAPTDPGGGAPPPRLPQTTHPDPGDGTDPAGAPAPAPRVRDRRPRTDVIPGIY